MDSSQLDRRQFLHATAGVATSVALASPTSALARSIIQGSPANVAPLTVGFWSGTRFVPASQLRMGDPTIERAQITIRGYGEGGALDSIEVLSHVPFAGEIRQVPFKAWVAPPSGGAIARFVMPVHPSLGLLLRIHQVVLGNGSVTPLALGIGAGSGAKLREGTYVLVGGRASLSSFAFVAESPSGSFIEAKSWNSTPQFVELSIERV